jgi:hypothetical protein
MQYSLGKPLKDLPGLDKDGFPQGISFLKHLATSPQGIRAALTLLTLTRAFTLRSDPNLKTITDPWLGTDTISDLELRTVLSAFKIRSGSVGEWKSLHTSTKSGPIGQALLSSLSELTLLPSKLLANIKLIGGNSLSNLIDENNEALDILEFIRPKNFKPKWFTISWW